jgi:uncharacterized Zn-finger protein
MHTTLSLPQPQQPRIPSALDSLASLALEADKATLHQPTPSPLLSSLLNGLPSIPSTKAPQDNSWRKAIRFVAGQSSPNVRRPASPYNDEEYVKSVKTVMQFDGRLKRFVPYLPPTPPLDIMHDQTYAEQNSKFGPEREKERLDFVCPHSECGKIFHRKSNLKSHLLSHSTEKPFICTLPNCTSRFSYVF